MIRRICCAIKGIARLYLFNTLYFQAMAIGESEFVLTDEMKLWADAVKEGNKEKDRTPNRISTIFSGSTPKPVTRLRCRG